MFVTDGESNYDKVCAGLLLEVEKAGAAANAPLLEGSVEDGLARIPLFGRDCIVRPDGVYMDGQKVDFMGGILIARYLLQAGRQSVGRAWLPYRDLKDGGQFSSFIKANIEDKIAQAFAGKRSLLGERLSGLGGVPAASDVAGDVALVVYPLPKLPVLCLFWDSDEEFPASFQFLFDASASSYLDLESLAVVLQYIYLKVIGEA
jgi:hypothetical protein